MVRAWVAVGLLVLCGLVVSARGVGFEKIFDREAGVVLLAMDDAQYHARRAAHTAEHFPEVLWFDPFLNYPSGAFVPWPPLYDFGLGALGRLFGDLDAVLAWAPVVMAVGTALLVFGIAAGFGGAACGLLAVGIFALLPVGIRYTAVGNPDHHAVVMWLATGLLAGHLAALSAAGARARGVQAALVLLRLTLLLSWHGSVLYVVLADGLALAVAGGLGRADALRLQALGCAATATFGFAALALPGSSFGGPWSAVELSRLQPASYAAMALAAFALARLAPGVRSALSRLGLVAGVCAGAAIALAGVARSGLTAAWEYASRAESFIANNYETQPLWSDAFVQVPELYGWLGWLLPLLPVAGLVRPASARPAAGLYLAGWSAALLVLAVSNARYGSDLAPAASVGFALLVTSAACFAGRRLRVPMPAAAVVGTVFVAVLLAPAALELAPHARRSLAASAGRPPEPASRVQPFSRSVYAFVDQVREATPEVAEPGGEGAGRPEYGILAPPTLGFILNARGRRATPAGNFGPYVGREGLEATSAFYRATREDDARDIARKLSARYVITTDEGAAPGRLWHRLHHGDGSQTERRAALGGFRLVTESARPGVPLGALRGAAPGFVEVPYKLFEVVEGAVLEVPAWPGTQVVAEVAVETPSGRRFVYRAEARSGAGGRALLRLPYATTDRASQRFTRALGPYRVQRRNSSLEVEVPPEAVQRGERIALPVPKPEERAPQAPESAQPLAAEPISGTFPAP